MDPRTFSPVEWGGLIALGIAIVMVTWHLEGGKFRRGRRLLDEIEAGARRKGWEFEVLHDLGKYRLRGRSPSGVPWTLEYFPWGHDSGDPPEIAWRAPSLAATPTAFRLTTPAAARRARDGPMRLTLELAGDLGMRMGSEPVKDMVELAAEQYWVVPAHPKLADRIVFLCREPRRREIFDADIEKPLVALPPGLGEALADRVARMTA
jgi:hypothetical protein